MIIFLYLLHNSFLITLQRNIDFLFIFVYSKKEVINMTNENDKLISKIDKAIVEQLKELTKRKYSDVSTSIPLTPLEKTQFSLCDKYQERKHYKYKFTGDVLNITYKR